MKKIFTGLTTFFIPSAIAVLILRLLGHKVGTKVKIGFSFLCCNKITIGNNVKIGHLNLFLNDKTFLSEHSIIGYFNILKGPFTLDLKKQAALGNKNYFTRGALGITYAESKLSLGVLTKITTDHHLDLTNSIIIGDYSILAGIRSQMWTHGYYHAERGKDRIRIDGQITIGDNVYIGSGCIFNPGVVVANSIHIGSGTVISKNIDKPGMYVGQELRYIENDIEIVKSKLTKVDGFNLVEQVYRKE